MSYKLATTLTRTQSPSLLASVTQCRPLLNIVKSNSQGDIARKAIFRQLKSFSSLQTSTRAPDANQSVTLRRSWSPIFCWNLRSMHSVTTRNQGEFGASMGRGLLKHSSARRAFNIYQDTMSQLHTTTWRSEIGDHKSSFTDSQAIRPPNSTLQEKSATRAEKENLDYSKVTAPFIGNKHIIDRLPNIPHIHRPTKEELLAAATGFWSRLKVRFKWFSIRSVRPFNVDEIGAFFSWFLLGHVLWIILGTTTFFSLAIFAVNTVFAQGMRNFPSICVQLMTI